MRMWRNWQTRMIQVHVGNHAGSSPVIRTKQNTYPKGWVFFGAKINRTWLSFDRLALLG